VLDKLLDDALMQGVSDVEQVFPVALSPLRIRGREVVFHMLERHELIVEVLDRQLIILRNLYVVDVLLLQELLLIREDLLGVVLGEHRVRAYIILQN
jgi:hypothetical protein